MIAYDTCFDSNPGQPDGTYTATWMDQTYGDIPSIVKKRAVTRTDWKSWSLPVGTHYYNAYHFFSRLEESVDLGVWYLANAMTWVMNEVGTYKCSLGVQDLKQAALKQVILGMMFMLLSYLGISLIKFFMRSSDSVWLLLYATV